MATGDARVTPTCLPPLNPTLSDLARQAMRFILIYAELMLVPELGSTVEFMKELLPDLKPREKRVIERIISNPDSVLEMSAADLGAQSGTSAATVIRACQSLGLKGFQHLRTLLIRDSGAAAVEERADEVEASGPAREVARQLMDASELLDSAARKLDDEVLEHAVELLSQANRIVVVGSGSSTATIQVLLLRSTFSGLRIEAPTDPVVQSLSCRLLGKDDVCLAISDSGMSQSTLAAAEAARKSGALVIAVTGYARSRLAEISTLTLVAGSAEGSWRNSALGSNLVQMVVVNALQHEVAKRRTTLDRATELASDEIFDSVVSEALGSDDSAT